MVYILLGDDLPAKDRKIAELKKHYLGDPAGAKGRDALAFDYEYLDAPRLDPKELKKALVSLPTIGSKRMVLLRAVNKLSAANEALLLEFIQKQEEYLVLVLESAQADERNRFIKEAAAHGKILRFYQKAKENVFAVTDAIAARNPIQALKMLHVIIENGDHPLQIMGGLVWFWGKSRPRLSAQRFQQGLMELQEADLNIKRSRVKPQQALEILVVRLVSLLAC